MKKRYEDMTPEEQFEYRITDHRGTIINGVLWPDPPEDDDEEEPESEAEDDSSKLDAVIDKIKSFSKE